MIHIMDTFVGFCFFITLFLLWKSYLFLEEKVFFKKLLGLIADKLPIIFLLALSATICNIIGSLMRGLL